MKLAQSIPLVMAGTPDGDVVVEPAPAPSTLLPPTHRSYVDLEPEIRTAPLANGSQTWTTIDMKLAVNLVTLHLYDGSTARESDLDERGIAKFVLNDSSLRLKMLTDGATEAQLILKSFTMSNTRHGNSKFREIIPAAQHDRNQFMLLYTMSGGQSGSALAILAVDSPQIILALDPIFALLAFFTAPAQSPPPSEVSLTQSSSHGSRSQSTTVDFRLDLHEVSVCVL
jgi:vacuolar protein sorting-associated protein 13A/C